MPWKKANKDLIKLLEETVPLYKCDMKAMFGSPTFFVNGRIVVFKASDDIEQKLLSVIQEKIDLAKKQATVTP